MQSPWISQFHPNVHNQSSKINRAVNQYLQWCPSTHSLNLKLRCRCSLAECLMWCCCAVASWRMSVFIFNDKNKYNAFIICYCSNHELTINFAIFVVNQTRFFRFLAAKKLQPYPSRSPVFSSTCFNHPLSRWPWSFHHKDCLVIRLLDFLSVWSIQSHFRQIIVPIVLLF